MKKIRTIISAVVIAILSVFVSACSCSGGEEPSININHIYAQSINIKCLTNTDSVISSVDPVSKDLYITCHVGDTFVIEYEITPANATTTQVDWAFSALGLVQPYKSEGFTRNNSTKEQVEFEAINRSDSNYKTTLSFTIYDLNKTANCYIEVYNAVDNLSTFVAPENLSFDTTTNSLTWSPVTKVIDQYGDIVPSKTVGGYPKGLTGYEIQRLDPVTGEVLSTDRVGKGVTTFGGLEAGVDYVYQVRATADGLEALSSEYSKSFKFYKLKAVEEISNNNGTISFESSERSNQSVFYYYGVANASTYSPYVMGTSVDSSTYDIPYTNFQDWEKNNTYNIEVVSFPESYDDKLGYALIGTEDFVRYYPSDASEEFVIEKLETPTVDLATTTGTVTIDGVTFANANLSSYISLNLENVYTANYGQGFSYELYIDGSLQTPVKTGEIFKDNKISIEGNSSNSYVLKVKTIGNSNTIESEVTTFKFNILSHLSNQNISLTDDILHHETTFTTGGVELFFVSNSNDSTNKQNYSVYRAVDSNNNTDFNIQELGLNAGKYDVYAKSISLIDTEYKNASIIPSTYSKIFTIDVAPIVSSNMITKDGVIMFKKLANYDNYKVIVNRKLKTALEYNEEQVVEIYAPTEANIKNGLLTYETSDTAYDEFGNTARISIESVVETYLADKYPSLDIKGFFGSDYDFKYSIITVGDGELKISSSPTTTFTIQRYDAVNNISLRYDVLKFGRVGTSTKQQYTIWLETYNSDGTLKNSYEFNDTYGNNITADDIVEVDLTKLIVKDGTSSLIDLVDTTATNKVLISALGTDGKANSPAVLNSIPTAQTFGLTNTPTGLTLDENGVLNWADYVNEEGTTVFHFYNIYFYKVSDDGNGAVYTKLTDYTIKGVSAQEIGNDVDAFADISDVLAENKDDVLAITVEEYSFNLFTNDESEPFFATRISAPTISRVVTDNNNELIWTANANANVYDITATKFGDDNFSYSNTGAGSNKLSITSRLTDSENPWKEGIYTVSVIARNTNNSETAGSDYTTPYVLNSVESTTSIYIVNAGLNITVSGDKISWNNICAGTSSLANYTISYTLSDGRYNTEDLDSSRSYDASTFTAGTNTVTINPTVDFVETGFVTIGFATTTQVKKLYAPTEITTESGNLVLYFDTVVEKEMTVELYQVVDGKDKVVSTDLYYVSSYENAEVNETNGQKYIVVIDGMDAGSLTLKAKVKLDGYLDSDLSNAYTGTKIAAVTDLIKNGDYFYWTAQPGISSYKIGYQNSGSDTLSYIDLIVEEVTNEEDGSYTYKAYVSVETELGTQTYTDADLFSYDETNNKFKYKFIEELFITDGQSGDIRFNIRPLTEEVGYFSGNTSQMITITKLNSNPTITVENGVVVISNYYADGSGIPSTYTLSIYKITTEEVTAEDGSVSTKITRDTEEYWTTTNNYKTVTEGYAIEPVDLNTIGLELEGDYEIALTFNGDGNYILDSKEISVVEYDKLATTSLYTEKGVLTWSEVDGAENYTIQISDGTNIFERTLNSTFLNEAEIAPPVEEPLPDEGNGEAGGEVIPDDGSGEGTENTEDTVVSTLSNVDTTGFVFNPGTWYTVKIRVNATGKLHSRWSDAFMLKKLYAPTNLDVKASVGNFTIQVEETRIEGEDTITETKDREIAVGTPIITWNDSNSQLKTNYSIKYADGIEEEIIYNEYLSYVLANNLPISTYYVVIKTYGNTSAGTDNYGYLTSDYSEEIEVNYVDDVKSPTVTNGIVSWSDSVKGAYAYRITAYDTTEYNAYLEAEDGVLPTAAFTYVTTSNNLNFQSIVLATNGSYGGSYTFVVEALTRPEDAIVTTDGTKTNTVNIFKPNTFVDYKVKNGRLYYKIAVADVIDFVEAQAYSGDTKLSVLDESIDRSSPTKVTQYVLNYVMRKINLKVGDNTALDEQIKHLLNIKVEVNGVAVTDTPDECKILDSDGNEVKVVSGYTSAEYIEYYYDVAIEPESVEETPEETPENPDDNTGDNVDSGEVIATAQVAETGEEYKYVAGKYTIRLSAIGNTVNDTPVVNGGYTASITAYKPNTPKTWTQDGADIYKGQVQWELSTTEKSTIDNFQYYENYQIRAVNVTTSGNVVKTQVSVNDTISGETNPNLTDGYLYYRDLKVNGDNNGLFTIDSDGDATNRLTKDTFYRLFISTVGTSDSSLLEEGETIYLNSNECLVNNSANILAGTKEISIKSSFMYWQTSYGSTATKLFIYGPFDCLNDAGTAVKSNWKDTETSDIILNKIQSVYNGEIEGLTNEEVSEYKGKLTIVDLAESEGVRPTNYTLTDTIINGKGFAPGGYIIKFQEMGDGRGVIDSEISSGIDAVKLGVISTISTSVANPDDTTNIMQVGGWVGLNDSYVYLFNRSLNTWKLKEFAENAPNEKVGRFVWNPVAGANTYEINLFYVDKNDMSGGEWLLTERTQETSYELPSGEAYNKEGYYFIRIIAMRTSNADVYEMSDKYFSADFIDTSKHERVPVPDALTIYGTGDIKWNYGYTYNDIGSYRVQFNYGIDGLTTNIIAESGTDSFVPNLNLGEGGQNGTVEISIKAVALSGNGKLNSGYCDSVKVTRLADPDIRLVNGVLYWGNVNGADPITATELTTNGKLEVISTPEGEKTYPTYLQYFTDITEHNDGYRSGTDELLYNVETHTFTAMFQGTGSGDEDGFTMDSDGDFYISSNVKSLTATKLSAPEILNVTDSDSGGENLVRWVLDSNATGYRVRVFCTKTHPKDLPYVEYNVSLEELLGLLADSTKTNTNFTIKKVTEESGEVTYVYFKINSAINEFDLDKNGGDLYIYVQALGSGLSIIDTTEDLSARPADGTTLYLSSSYSTHSSIGVPPDPSSINFNSSTGVLSWNLVDTDNPTRKIVCNIKIDMTYTVSNVTETELSYWKSTADKFIVNNIDEAVKTQTVYSEIISRTVIVGEPVDGLYTLSIADVVLLKSSDYDSTTPLSYKITSTGTNYSFGITAMTFVNSSSSYVSQRVTQDNLPTTFQTFGGGDGSEDNPYKISNLSQLQAIANFNDRAFILTDTISFVNDKNEQSYWNIISTFDGTLYGNNKTIDKFAVKANQVSASNANTNIMSLFETNNGTIKDLTIKLNDTGFVYTTSGGCVQAATIAINNNGTIDSVNTEGTIELVPVGQRQYNINTLAGGIVVNNNKTGIINNASVNMVITSLDDSEDFASAGGVATNNYGTITNSNYNGTITSNRVAGIVATNMGVVDKCYVTKDSIINVTNTTYTGTGLKGAVVGGLVATLTRNTNFGQNEVKITNSYSLAKIVVTKGGDANSVGYTVGGFVGTIDSNSSIEVSNCYAVVNIVKNTIAGINTIDVYHMLGESSDAVISNNYYLVETCELTVSTSSMNTTGVCEMVASSTVLNSKLETLGVYDITEGGYPTLKK